MSTQSSADVYCSPALAQHVHSGPLLLRLRRCSLMSPWNLRADASSTGRRRRPNPETRARRKPAAAAHMNTHMFVLIFLGVFDLLLWSKMVPRL
ncbi:unnamed protein product [Pleuronectes platessa]|uniref:Uncharacterized protein n=1 Tax=Pleuronectes platessa TaxID=8262 RepID=A0A9N7YNB7_PLEPL|nr:unnamed protein product [Pleuronectes platessa]